MFARPRSRKRFPGSTGFYSRISVHIGLRRIAWEGWQVHFTDDTPYFLVDSGQLRLAAAVRCALDSEIRVKNR
jgi:hypothetical protein